MVAGTRLTIQDYFKQAGGGSEALSRRSPQIPQGAQDGDFHRVLEGMQPSAPVPAASAVRGGLRIGDYWKHPIAAKIPVRGQTVEAAPTDGDMSTPAAEKTAVKPTESIETSYSTGSSFGAAPAAPDQPSTDSRIAASIRSAAAKYDLSAGLIRSVIRAESNFQPDAVSHAGAQGLMQLMPATAQALGVEDPFDIEQNIDGGVRYLRQMLDMFGGNLKKALAAYNAGPGTVMRYNGDVPYRETRAYIQKVMSYARRFTA
jgi:soluble lytic murein transglycosylase-like protein